MVTILIVIVVLMLVGAIPSWPHSRNWGYGPSGGVGLVLLILVILMLSGPWWHVCTKPSRLVLGSLTNSAPSCPLETMIIVCAGA